MSLPDGVTRSLGILRFQQSLRGEPEGESSMEDTYRRVFKVLEEVGVRWALVGAHAVNIYVRPRATEDVDVVVDARRMNAVIDALREEFGDASTLDIGPAIRVANLSLDLIRGDNHPLFMAALDLAREREGVRLPPPELLMALKFLSAVSPWRNPADRKQDAADLIRIYQTLGADLDREAAIAHARLAFPGADVEFRSMLDRLDRGEDVAL